MTKPGAVPGDSDKLVPLARCVATMFVGAVGLLIFANVGALVMPTPPGVGSIVFGFFGLIFFSLLGCCVTGFWRDFLPEEGASMIVEREVRKAAGLDRMAQLVVTVRKVVNVSVHGRLWEASENWFRPELGNTHLSRPNLFVEMYNGQNPIKATCVKQDGVFNEQFQMHVTFEDRTLLIVLQDQQLYGSTQVGYVSLEIDRDIISGGLPRKGNYPIRAGEGYTLRQPANTAVEDRAFIELEFSMYDGDADTRAIHNKVSHLQPLNAHGEANENHYGAVSFLSALTFDRAGKMHETDPDKHGDGSAAAGVKNTTAGLAPALSSAV